MQQQHIPPDHQKDSFDAPSSWQQAPDGEKLRPRSARRPRHLGRAIALVLLLIIISGIGAYILLPMKLGYTVLQEKHTFFVQRHPRLSVYDSAGTITVHKGGAGDTITVIMTTHKGLLTQAPGLGYVHNSAFVNLSIPFENKDTFGGHTTVDLDITVPQDIDLNVNAGEAYIGIEGITSKINVTSTAGWIHLKHDTLTDTGTIHSEGGDVALGSVTLAQGSQYSVSTTTGNLDASFTPGETFHLEATATRSTVKSDLPTITVQSNNQVGQLAHGNVGGNQPTATIILRTNTGIINLHKTSDA